MVLYVVIEPVSFAEFLKGLLGPLLFNICIGPASVRSYKIGVVGNNWLVGNAVFSDFSDFLHEVRGL